MTTRHSLFTRGLSLLLAFCMLLSNMGGLTLRAEAADSMLFDLIAESETARNDAFDDIMENRSAIPAVEQFNVSFVEYETHPLEEEGIFMYNGLLELEPIGNWTPVSYELDGERVAYNGPIQLDVEEFPVYFVRDYGVSDELQGLYNYLTAVGSEAAEQRDLLDGVSGTKALTALKTMNFSFIDGMVSTVQNLTVEDVAAVGDSSYKDGKRDLEAVKETYVDIILQMEDLLVYDGPYMDYTLGDGSCVYEDYLLIYAMLAEYRNQGLRHYYENVYDINAELAAMASVLHDILGEYNEEIGAYEYESIIDAVLEIRGYSNEVSASQLRQMADNMDAAAGQLPNRNNYIADMDLSDADAVDYLFYATEGTPALISQFNSYGLYLENASQEAEVWAYYKEVETEPTETEPVETEPTETEPVETEPVETEPTEPELGSEENPIMLQFTWHGSGIQASTNGNTVPAGETVYFQANGLGGMNVVAVLSAGPNKLDGAVTMNGEAMPVVETGTFNAVATGNPRMPTVFAVTNNSETDGAIYFNVNYILGSQMNPEVIESMPYNVASVSLAEGDDDGYYYTYTAEGDGTVTFYFGYMEDAPEADIVVMNNNTYQQKSLLMDGVDNYGLELTMDVSKGDVLMIQVVVVPDESWNIPAADLEWIGNYTAVPGTEANPFEIEWIWNDAYTEATATVEVAAGATVYYNAMTGMIMTVNGEEFAVEGMTFCLTNEGEEAAVYELAVSYPVGTYENPDQLVLGENTAKVEENTWGYYFTWTAEADGTLSVTMPEGDWFYVINSNGVDPEDWSDDVYGEGQYSDKDPVNPGTIDVVAGENVIVQVNTYDPASWDTPAGTITFTAAFEAVSVDPEEPTEPSEPSCEHEYFYPCDAHCMHCGELTNEEAAHTVTAVEAKEATCEAAGNVAYWICSDCGSCWLDEALTQQTNRFNVVVWKDHEYYNPCDQHCMHCGNLTNENAAHTIVHVEAKAGTDCQTWDGNVEYWTCSDCGGCWLDEALTQQTNRFGTVCPGEHSYFYACDAICMVCYEETNPDAAHTIVHVDAVEATCQAMGNIEYWTCSDCGACWSDEALTMVTNRMSVVTFKDHEYFYACDAHCMNCGELTNEEAAHAIVHMSAVAPSCFENGNIEYWTCEYCNSCWDNENATGMPLNAMSVKLPMAHAELTHVEAKEATCFEDGNIEYWTCEACGYAWLDAEGTLPTNLKAVILSKAHAELTHVEAKAANCNEEGNIEYWFCADCGYAWLDAEGTLSTNLLAVVLPVTHNTKHVEAKDATCYEVGNIEHWYCLDCDCVWTDESLIPSSLSNHKNVILPIIHNIEHVEAVAATCDAPGNIEYWYCTECGSAWTDELLRGVTNLKSVIVPAQCTTIKHVEAVTPSCYTEGNIEYWYCELCGKAWQDEKLLQLTNMLSVILPAACQSVVYVEAKDATCTENGNQEYWYCQDCQTVWQDENLTQITNIKNVVIPAACAQVKHALATAPTCYTEGNIKYYYCEDCMGVWKDAAQTEPITLKQTVIPAACQSIVRVSAKASTCTKNGNIQYWYCKDCNRKWSDAGLTKPVTNVTVAASHKNVKTHTGYAAKCHETGMKTYYECLDCKGIFSNKACTTKTTVAKCVIKATMPKLTYVKAVNPKYNSKLAKMINGNLAHYKCNQCGGLWWDANATQKTSQAEILVKGTHMFAQSLTWFLKLITRSAEGEGVPYVTFKCAYCDEVVEIPADMVTNTITEKTCSENGEVEHVPTVVLNGQTFTPDNTGEQEITLEIENEDGTTETMPVTATIENEDVEIKSETIPAGHTYEHVAAKAATCHTAGNKEYWYCTEEDCGEFFLEEPNADSTPVDFNESIFIAPTDKVIVVDELCQDSYLHCEGCGKNWLDTELTVEVSDVSTLVHHSIEKSEYVAPGCNGKQGSNEYWYCTGECQGVWADEDLRMITNRKNVIIPSLECNIYYVEAVAPSCEKNGTISYYACEGCGRVWADAEGENELDKADLIVEADCQKIIHVSAKAATCTKTGNIEYWYCAACGKRWSDAERTTLVDNVTIPVVAHTAKKVATVENDCYEDGHIEYWTCTVCGQKWTDEALTKLVKDEAELVIPAAHGTIEHVEAVAATCFETGNIEYWYCEACGQAWLDEACLRNTNLKSVVLPMAHAELTHVEAKAASCFENGNIEYWYCADCGYAWLNAEGTLSTNLKSVVLPMAHTKLTHVEAKAATCEEPGNIEYWYCADCGYAWLDAEGTQVTNLMSVILPIVHKVKHVEAKTPACNENGNIEYWYCELCGFAWLDELCRQNTNLKAVVLPAAPNAEHMEEKAEQAPTYTENGNYAHWHCTDCGLNFHDQAHTEVYEDVVIPYLGGNAPEAPIVVKNEEGASEFIWTKDEENEHKWTETVELGYGKWYLKVEADSTMKITVNGKEAVRAGNGNVRSANADADYVTIEIDNTDTERGKSTKFELAKEYPIGHAKNPNTAFTVGSNGAWVKNGIELWTGNTGYYINYKSPAASNQVLILSMPDVDWSCKITNKSKGESTDVTSANSADNCVYYDLTAKTEYEIVINLPDGEYTIPATRKGSGTYRFTAAQLKTVTANAGTQKPGAVLTVDNLNAIIADLTEDLKTYNEKNGTKWIFDSEEFFNTWNGRPMPLETKLTFDLKLPVAVNGVVKNLIPGANNTISLLNHVAEDNTIMVGKDAVALTETRHFSVSFNGEDCDVKITVTDKKITEDTTFTLDPKKDNSITVNSTVTENRLAMEYFADYMNSKDVGAFKVVEKDGVDTLVADLSASGVIDFVKEYINVKYQDSSYGNFNLYGEAFLKTKTGAQISIDGLVNALFMDTSFTSEYLVALADAGKGQLLDAEFATDLCKGRFILNLTNTSALKKATDLLRDAEGVFSFQADGKGGMDIHVTLPDEVYEAYIAEKLITGEINKADELYVDNSLLLELLKEYAPTLINEKVDIDTYMNTLQILGVNKDLNKYEAAYTFIRDFVVGEHQSGVENGNAVFTPNVGAGNDGYDIRVVMGQDVIKKAVVDVLDRDDLKTYMDSIAEDPKTEINIDVITDNSIPTFEAVIVDYERIVNTNMGAAEAAKNAASGNVDSFINSETTKTEKLRALGMTRDLSAEAANIYGTSYVMLVKDIPDSVSFANNTVLDLNGHKIAGNVEGIGNVTIVDSTRGSVSDGSVASVSGNVCILAGTYGSDVDAYLPDGYFQDDTGMVRNSLFYMDEVGNIYIDGSVYLQETDGLLPAVKKLATDIAVDMILNNFFVGALEAEGKNNGFGYLYNVALDDMIGMLNDGGFAADQLLACVDATALSDFINVLLEDLLNVDVAVDALKTGSTIGNYNFRLHAWDGALQYVEDGDYLSAYIAPKADFEPYSICVMIVNFPTEKVIEIPNTDRSYTVERILDEMALIVNTSGDDKEVSTEAEIYLDQPIRSGKTITFPGSGKASLSLNFSHNENYTRALAAALAYFYEDLTLELVKNGCIVELEEVLASITVGEFFDTINKVVQNKEVPFEKIASKLELKLTNDQLADLTKAYDYFQLTVGKIIDKFDLDVNESTPLSELMENGVMIVDGNIQTHDADVTAKGITVEAVLKNVDATLMIELYNGGEHIWNEGEVTTEPTCMEDGVMTYTCTKCDEFYTEVIPALNPYHNNAEYAEHIIHVDAVAKTCYENGNVEYWYCDLCNTVWIDEALTQISNHMNVIVPMSHADATHVAAKAPTCYEEGNNEYWYCADCGQAWLDEACTLNTNILSEKLPITHEGLNHVDAKDPDCSRVGNDRNGNIEYWYCSICGKYWSDDLLRNEINKNETVIEFKHEIEHVDAVDATCEKPGNIEYTKCAVCGAKWNTKGQLITETLIAAIGHKWNDGEVTVEATCEKTGVMTYTCKNDSTHTYTEEIQMKDHEYFYECDAHCMNCNELTNPNAAHNLIRVNAKPGTDCQTWDGNIEYWYCEHCNTCWDNAEAIGMPLNVMMIKATGAHKPGAVVIENEDKYGWDEVVYCEVCGDEQSRERIECRWGDADHDGDVDNHDASLIFEWFMNDGKLEDDKFFCEHRTDVDGMEGITNHDASNVFEYFMNEDEDAKFPVEE